MYHLRYSVNDRDKGEEVLDLYLKAFPVWRIIASYEEVEDNLHIHCHIEYKEHFDATCNAAKVKRTTFFKKMKEKELIPDKPESSYHESLKKTELENIAYVIKDKDIIYEDGIGSELLEKAKNYSIRVETEKSTKMKHQLQQLWVQKNGIPLNKQQIYMFIDFYHIQRDFLPPNMSQKLQYAIYILHKTFESFSSEQKAVNSDFYYNFYSELTSTYTKDDLKLMTPHYNQVIDSVKIPLGAEARIGPSDDDNVSETTRA